MKKMFFVWCVCEVQRWFPHGISPIIKMHVDGPMPRSQRHILSRSLSLARSRTLCLNFLLSLVLRNNLRLQLVYLRNTHNHISHTLVTSAHSVGTEKGIDTQRISTTCDSICGAEQMSEVGKCE